MNECSVELSPDAQTDVVEIRDYIRNVLKNETAADCFLEDTLDAVDSLESFPYDHMVRTDPAHVGSVEKRQSTTGRITACFTSSKRNGNW